MLTTNIFQTVNLFSKPALQLQSTLPQRSSTNVVSFYKNRPKPAATTASTPPVISTPNAEAAPVPVALAALPLADSESDSAAPEVALAALDVAMLDPEEVLLATILVVVP